MSFSKLFCRSYDWNYNLNRHLKYECGKENAFQCAKCGRKFPHKQNCVYHLKRKHKIVCDTIDQYMAQGLVIFRGGQGAGGQQVANPEWRYVIHGGLKKGPKICCHKNCHKFQSTTTKNKNNIITYCKLFKNLKKKFVLLFVMLWVLICYMSDCTVL